MWESDSQPFEVISEDNYFNELNVAATPYLFSVVPAATNATESQIVDLAAVKSATVDVLETHQIVARDIHRNLKQDQLDVFEVTLTKNDDASVQVIASVTSPQDSIYTIEYTLTKAGTYSMEVLAFVDGEWQHCFDSNTQVTC